MTPLAQLHYTIERKVIGYAYPRNGNLHNPTEQVRWIVRDFRGSPCGTYSTKRAARDLIENYLEGIYGGQFQP